MMIDAKYAGLLSKSARTIQPLQDINLDAYDRFNLSLHEWIMRSKNTVCGLPESGILVSGITDAFNQTYAIYNKIGIFKGEYGYHNLAMADRVTYKVSEADIIVISHPFSGDGMSSHDKIAEADKLNIPIFVDCAFFGICDNVSFDFSKYKNIRSVCFSLSKTFSTGLRRVGMLYTFDRYPAHLYNEWAYPFIAGAEYHYDLLNRIDPDYMYNKYRIHQLDICRDLGLEPSDTVIFGMDKNGRYPEYQRNGIGRVCISAALQARLSI